MPNHYRPAWQGLIPRCRQHHGLLAWRAQQLARNICTKTTQVVLLPPGATLYLVFHFFANHFTYMRTRAGAGLHELRVLSSTCRVAGAQKQRERRSARGATLGDMTLLHTWSYTAFHGVIETHRYREIEGNGKVTCIALMLLHRSFLNVMSAVALQLPQIARVQIQFTDRKKSKP